jgi:hypothetical protein
MTKRGVCLPQLTEARLSKHGKKKDANLLRVAQKLQNLKKVHAHASVWEISFLCFRWRSHVERLAP